MSIQYLGTRAPSNPYRLSPHMVAALIGAWPEGDGYLLRETSKMGVTQVKPGLQRRGLAEKRNNKWILTDEGLRERARLVDILEEDEHL